MAHENSSSISFESLKRQALQIGRYFFDLGFLEFRAATLSVIIIFVGISAILFLLLTAWIAAMAAFCFFLHRHGLSFYVIMSIVALLQFLMILPILCMIQRYSKKLLFTKTRAAIDIFIS
jgi:hypothetical protein